MALWFGEALIVTRQPLTSPLQLKLLLYSVDKKKTKTLSPFPRGTGGFRSSRVAQPGLLVFQPRRSLTPFCLCLALPAAPLAFLIAEGPSGTISLSPCSL